VLTGEISPLAPLPQIRHCIYDRIIKVVEKVKLKTFIVYPNINNKKYYFLR